jgi:hypothetical protein
MKPVCGSHGIKEALNRVKHLRTGRKACGSLGEFMEGTCMTNFLP